MWSEVDRYIAGKLIRDGVGGDVFAHDHAVSPPQGALLELLARAAGARRILEIGTLEGYSTLWLARSGASVVTLEIDPDRAARARAALGHRAEVIVGPALETLPTLDGPFDLIFIDADKRSNAEYLRHALRLSRVGTLIVADNVIRDGAVADPDHPDPSVQGVRAFFDALAAEPGVRATAIQTVGAKGYDGFALALVGG
jgi:predicted O-methyltransferase YrrM